MLKGPQRPFSGGFPVEAEVVDSDGVLIHVLLHVLEGFLDELEIYREDSEHLVKAIRADDLEVIVY